MKITLTGAAEEFIKSLVADGGYRDADEAVTAACLFFRQWEKIPQEELPPGVQEEVLQASRGPFHSDWDAMIQRVRQATGLKAEV